METNKIYHGKAKEVLEKLPDNSINTCVTSPPYWGLRDYGVKGQLGLEPTPEEYIERLVDIFAEVNRVLKDDGTLWLNIGDTYNGKPCGGLGNTGVAGNLHESNFKATSQRKMIQDGRLKEKDLVGVPWRLAFALQEEGWYIRSDIIWHKNNPTPESVSDRPTRAHEHIFLLTKAKKYYYNINAIKEKANGHYKTKNKRDVWQVNVKPFPEAHFAVYPPDLIRPCVRAGCPDDGIVLDPFMGAGATALVALQENKNFVGIELNQEYIDIAYKRIGKLDKEYYKEIPKEKRPEQKQLF